MKRKILLIGIAIPIFVLISISIYIYLSNKNTIQNNVRILKKAVVANLNDPESARFRSLQLQSMEGSVLDRLKLLEIKNYPLLLKNWGLVFKYNPELFQLCGEINAKNGFGAYVGYKKFYISGGEDPIPFIAMEESNDFPKNMCDIGKDGVVYSEPDHE